MIVSSEVKTEESNQETKVQVGEDGRQARRGMIRNVSVFMHSMFDTYAVCPNKKLQILTS